MIEILQQGTQVVLVGVFVFPKYLEVAVGFFEAGLSEQVLELTGADEAIRARLPCEAVGLKGRARVYGLKLEIV